MQCTYLVRGKRCRRQAEPQTGLCVYHLAWADNPKRRLTQGSSAAPSRQRKSRTAPSPISEPPTATEDSFSALVSEETQRLLDEASAAKGLDEQIAFLRVMIRLSFEAGDFEETRRSIAVLGRLLQGRPENSGEGELDRILRELDEEQIPLDYELDIEDGADPAP